MLSCLKVPLYETSSVQFHLRVTSEIFLNVHSVNIEINSNIKVTFLKVPNFPLKSLLILWKIFAQHFHWFYVEDREKPYGIINFSLLGPNSHQLSTNCVFFCCSGSKTKGRQAISLSTCSICCHILPLASLIPAFKYYLGPLTF